MRISDWSSDVCSSDLAYALVQSKVTTHSAHVATYGERAVDTFYLTDLLGGKLESKARLATLEKRLMEAAGAEITEKVLEVAYARTPQDQFGPGPVGPEPAPPPPTGTIWPSISWKRPRPRPSGGDGSP